MSSKLKDVYIDIPIDDIYKEESRNAKITVKNDKSILNNFNGTDFFHNVIGIERFVMDIATSKDIGFEEMSKPNGVRVIKALPLARYFGDIRWFTSAYSENYVYSEYVDAFFKGAKTFGMMENHLDHPNAIREKSEDGSIKFDSDAFNALIVFIRSWIKSRRFKKQAAARINNAERNYASLVNYEKALFDRYSRLLVLRVDLAYYEPKPSTDPHDSILHDTPLETVIADRERFLNNIRRNQLFNHLVGYVWKLEYGYTKGHHTHLILFFDGSKRHKDAHLAQQLSEYWKNEITAGKGYAYNCNWDKSVYTKLGIGMINHSDDERRTNLKLIFKYFTKKEQCLHRKFSAKCKVMGRGEMPKQRTSNAGRHRK